MRRRKSDLVVKSRLYSSIVTRNVTSFTPYLSFAASTSTSRSACSARNSYCFNQLRVTDQGGRLTWTSRDSTGILRTRASVCSDSSSRPTRVSRSPIMV